MRDDKESVQAVLPTKGRMSASINWTGGHPETPQGFFLEVYPRVYSFVSRYADVGHQEVEDIVQDTLCHAWRDRDSFKGQSDPVTWVIAIAKNRMREHYRSSTRRKAAMTRIMDGLSRLEASEISKDLLESDEVKAQVMEALGGLDSKSADVLFRFYYDGQSVREIAAACGDSEDAVESRLRRAKSSFLMLLQGRNQDVIG